MSVSHCIKAYKGEIWLERTLYQSYGEFKRDQEETGADIARVKNEIKQLCLCTPKDLFPTDQDGDTYYHINERIDELFDELNDLEWKMSKINLIQTILDDWEYVGKKDPKKYWDKINPDPYEDLRKEMVETISTFDGNPESIKKSVEESNRLLEEALKNPNRDVDGEPHDNED